MKRAILMILVCFLLSCKKTGQERWFEAVVINTADFNCSKPVVQFQQSDSAEVCALTGFNTLTYITYSLEDRYNYLNNIIYVKITGVPEAWVGPPCVTVGINYWNVWFSEVRQK